MQRPQGISAQTLDAPCEGDVAARLSAGLKRLAGLRARGHGDWSDGPVTLLDVANADLPAGDMLCGADDTAFRSVAPMLAPMFAASRSPLPLRGRFADTADASAAEPTVDASWLDLAAAAPTARYVPTPVLSEPMATTPPIDVSPTSPCVDQELDPLSFTPFGAAPGAIALATLTGVTATPPQPAWQISALMDEPPADVPCATPGLHALLALTAPISVGDQGVTGHVAPVPPDEDAPPSLAVGAFVLTFAQRPEDPKACATLPPPAPDDPPPHLAVGAFPLTFADTPAISKPRATVSPVAPAPDEQSSHLAFGAFPLPLGATHAVSPPHPATAAPTSPVEAAEENDFAFGASPSLAALLEIAPPCEGNAPAVRAFEPQSLIDDALADAFEALLCAPEPIDPFEAAWTPEAVLPADATPQLASLEAHLWGLPRHVPCIEPFLLSPNHEIAVRLTRALRLRANMLEARAFAQTAHFGFLRTETDVQAFWFLADALHDAASLSAGDADVDASFADWRVNDDGLLVVTAPDNAHPKRPPPLISEAELDALFAHVEDAQSRIVLDDLSDDPAWNETFWCDVDTYLEHVSQTMDPALLDAVDRCAADTLNDIEVLARVAPEPAPVATYFWMPGDDFEMVVAGDGGDLFIVGASETPAVVLVEDGSSYAMRTGKAARADEVVVSLSFDAWRYIDAMQWRKLATLSGIAAIRVEQNAAATRHAVVAGAFFATALEDDSVRLVRSTDGGEVDFPVTRLGATTLDGDWGFADAAA